MHSLLNNPLQILRSRFPKHEFEITETKVFKFAHQPKDSVEQQHAITIQFDTHLPYGWTAGKIGSKVDLK